MLLEQQGWIESAATGCHTPEDLNLCPVSTGRCFALMGTQSWINRHSLEFGLLLCFQGGKETPSWFGENGGWKDPGLKQALLS